MNHSSDIDTLHSQVVFLKMREKTTEELTSIWTENNPKAWSKDELDATQKILLERLGKLPGQKKIINNKRPHFEFSLVDKMTLGMAWFFMALCAAWIIVSKILDGK